jgi:hypothetical protein
VSGVIDSLLTNYIFPEVSLHRTASRRRVSVAFKQKMALPGSSDNNPYGGVDTGSTMTVTSRDRSPGPCTPVEEGTYEKRVPDSLEEDNESLAKRKSNKKKRHKKKRTEKRVH